MYKDRATVLWNRPLGPGYYRMGLTCHPDYAWAAPGQFMMLKLPGPPMPLLRRPFSIHRIRRDPGGGVAVEILYQVVGQTTRSMAALAEGGIVDLIGPLGRGFSISEGPGSALIAAGGIGVAPLLFLAEKLLEHRVPAESVTVFIGGRSRQDLLCAEDFDGMGMRVVTTTDDGSAGDQCLITLPLESAMRKNRPDMVYACGPTGMLDCVVGLARSLDVPCQVSIETLMACGMGACLGCAVESRTEPETAGRYLHACVDGPVFSAQTLKCGP